MSEPVTRCGKCGQSKAEIDRLRALNEKHRRWWKKSVAEKEALREAGDALIDTVHDGRKWAEACARWREVAGGN